MNVPTAALAIDARRLVKLFASTPALLRVDLSVPAGAVCAIVGGNGAGKSTLLRVLATAVRPTSGTARIHGYDVVGEPQAARALIDLMPAGPGCYPELSAEENLRFALAMRGAPERAAEIPATLDRVGLRRAGRDPTRTFSTGMLRRLAVARLRLARPAVALLDEPYGALDEDGRQLVDELLADVRSSGRTAVLATHEQNRAGALADMICRLERGGVVSSDGAVPRDGRVTTGATA